MGSKVPFEELVAKCMEDKSFLKTLLASPNQYGLSPEEIEVLQDSDLNMIGFQLDERKALYSLGMWSGTDY